MATDKKIMSSMKELYKAEKAKGGSKSAFQEAIIKKMIDKLGELERRIEFLEQRR
jgi:hypothetical protein